MANSLDMNSFDVVADDSVHKNSPTQNKYADAEYGRSGSYQTTQMTSVSKSTDLKNNLKSSQRTSGNDFSATDIVQVAKKSKKSNRHTVGLASSTYVRNVDAISVIQKDIASGASKYLFVCLYN